MKKEDRLEIPGIHESIAVELDSLGRSAGVELEPEEDHIREPFDPDKIEVLTRTPTVSLVLARIRRRTIDLSPDFQRRAGIWDKKNQSRLIESLLLRIPLPTFYAAENEDEKWSIVDGIQRLTTIARFIQPESIHAQPLVLSDLEYLKEYNGKTFDDLPGRLKTRLEETEIVLHLIRQGTPEEVKFNIFARINTGGLPLSTQELRHALIPGPARELLGKLATSKEFLAATMGSVSSERMADREMALRFLAFRLNPPEKYGSRDFDEFLRRSMRIVNRLSKSDVARLSREYSTAMSTAKTLFGKHAFRKQYENQNGRYPINKALFETIAVNLATRSHLELNNLIENKGALINDLLGLFTDPDFDRSISVGTGDIAKVRGRFSDIDRLFQRHDGSSD
ncbi:DUF262 domain-containing protein [Kibdelosporangium aridum]|uniref:DUF262 domain-containing protein n=1 Tax=Kibdelosporangium aridum TaxID=2030 RepID=A0A428YBF8_KIBAR|nr:DUF262 domain-containing protein [Kibdelosporangium aridum]RSM64878.1 DUF262 domain-containing protein [Kibdelosporangium aridum]